MALKKTGIVVPVHMQQRVDTHEHRQRCAQRHETDRQQPRGTEPARHRANPKMIRQQARQHAIVGRIIADVTQTRMFNSDVLVGSGKNQPLQIIKMIE